MILLHVDVLGLPLPERHEEEEEDDEEEGLEYIEEGDEEDEFKGEEDD